MSLVSAGCCWLQRGGAGGSHAVRVVACIGKAILANEATSAVDSTSSQCNQTCSFQTTDNL